MNDQSRAAALVLVGLIPAVVYTLSRGQYVVALSLLSTVLIAASVYLMFSPTDAEIEWAKPL